MLAGLPAMNPCCSPARANTSWRIGAICTHYGAPARRWLLVGETVRCPWHHACFGLRSGEALRAPHSSVSCWRVERRDGILYVHEKLETTAPRHAFLAARAAERRHVGAARRAMPPPKRSGRRAFR